MTKNTLVLIVEDDPWMTDHYVRGLEAAGYSVVTAPNGLAAIDRVDTRRPDVIVLDIMLPGPNAFVLLHELQSYVDLAAIPVVLASNSVDALAEEDLRLYGVRATLDKSSMQPEDVALAVKRVLL